MKTDSNKVYEALYYRRQLVSEGGQVLVSILFGKPPEDGVRVVKRLLHFQDVTILQYNLDRYLKDVFDGVTAANAMYDGNLQVEEIEVIPSDVPAEGQIYQAAFEISKQAILGEAAEQTSVCKSSPI